MQRGGICGGICIFLDAFRPGEVCQEGYIKLLAAYPVHVLACNSGAGKVDAQPRQLKAAIQHPEPILGLCRIGFTAKSQK